MSRLEKLILAICLLAVAVVLAGEAVYRTNPIQHPPRVRKGQDVRVLEPIDTERAATLPGPVSAVATWKDGVVAAGEEAGFNIVLPTPAGGLALQGGCQLPAAPQSITCEGDLALISCAWGGTTVVDMSQPASPTVTTTVPSGSSSRATAVSGDFAYVADWDSGMQVISLEDTRTPSVLTFVDTPGHAYDIAVADDYAYVADFDGGIRVFDVSIPDDPQPAGAWLTMPAPTGIAIDGTIVYIVDEQKGLFVVDIRDAEKPRILANIKTEVAPRDIVLAEGRALVSDLAGGVSLYDITEPKEPLALGRTQIGQGLVGTAAQGSTAFFASGPLLTAEVGK